MAKRPEAFHLSPSRLARYFYHDCARHLRYHATPKARRAGDAVPDREHRGSPLAEAILQSGYDWEAQVVREHLGKRAVVARGPEDLCERHHDDRATLAWLRDPRPGKYLYQASLTAPPRFYAAHGLDPDLVHLGTCRPDLIEAVADGDQVRLRVVDVKASDEMKTSHAMQVALYVLILESLLAEHGVPARVDRAQGGIWLYQTPAYEPVALGAPLQVIEGFLRDQVPGIFTGPAADLPWHLWYRCEWCDCFPHCRKEAEDTGSVSLLPYLSVPARQFLAEGPFADGQPVNTLAELEAALADESSEAVLDACGSLRGRRRQLANAARALRTGEAVPQEELSLRLPIREDVRLVITAQREPLGGRVYALGFRRISRPGILEDTSSLAVFVAGTPDDCDRVRRGFVRGLHAELAALHARNVELEWGEQAALQTYVYDGFEARSLTEVLLASLTDPEVAEPALQLFFHFHAPELASADRHAAVGVPYPVVVLSGLARHLMALPVHLAYRLPEVLAALPSDGFDYVLHPSSRHFT